MRLPPKKFPFVLGGKGPCASANLSMNTSLRDHSTFTTAFADIYESSSHRKGTFVDNDDISPLLPEQQTLTSEDRAVDLDYLTRVHAVHFSTHERSDLKVRGRSGLE